MSKKFTHCEFCQNPLRDNLRKWILISSLHTYCRICVKFGIDITLREGLWVYEGRRKEGCAFGVTLGDITLTCVSWNCAIFWQCRMPWQIVFNDIIKYSFCSFIVTDTLSSLCCRDWAFISFPTRSKIFDIMLPSELSPNAQLPPPTVHFPSHCLLRFPFYPD